MSNPTVRRCSGFLSLSDCPLLSLFSLRAYFHLLSSWRILTLRGDPVLVRTAWQAAVVGVKTSHVTRPITPRGGTLDLPLLWPTALWIEEGRRREEEKRMGIGETQRWEGQREGRRDKRRREGGMNKEDKSEWLMPSDSLLGWAWNLDIFQTTVQKQHHLYLLLMSYVSL